MQVLITTDVELWPRGWDLSSREMTRAFQQYIHGRTARGAFGLSYQLEQMSAHGLRGVFFVEPLFASVLGHGALEEVVGLIRDAGQEVQLHLHTEWMGRAGLSELPGPPRMSMRELDEKEQARLLGMGRRWLEEAGAPPVTAFRAGAYGADLATLRALRRVGIGMDSSHNLAGSRGPLAADLDDIPCELEGVLEVPQTVYLDAFGRLRHAQVGSSSLGELEVTLAQASAHGRQVYVVLSHSAELLTDDRERPDRIAVRRFEQLCKHLADHRKTLPTAGFNEVSDAVGQTLAPPDRLAVGVIQTMRRYGEQAARRVL